MAMATPRSPLLDPVARAAGASGSSDAYKYRRVKKEEAPGSGHDDDISMGFASLPPYDSTIRIGSEQPKSGSEHNNGSGSTTIPANQGDVSGQGNKWWRPLCPAYGAPNDKATSLFLSKVTDTAVMGLVTLATFNATYLLAWGKPGTKCIPKFDSSKPPSGPSWKQVMVALVPFVLFPLTLYWSGLAKMAETDKRALSFVAGACLFEFIFAIILGAWTSYCMTGLQHYTVIVVALCLIVALAVTWGLTFKYPKVISFHRGEIVDATETVADEPPTLPSHGAHVSSSP